MAVRIRLKRTGRKNRPFYRICVFDARTRRDGAPVEELGSYDPRARTLEEKVQLKLQRAHYWLTVGAQPSETVASILKSVGVRKDGPVPEQETTRRPEPVTATAETPPAAAEAAEAPAVTEAANAVAEATAVAEAEPEGDATEAEAPSSTEPESTDKPAQGD